MSTNMTDPFEGIFLPPEEKDIPAWYAEHVEGTYTSSWDFLRASAASSFLWASRSLDGVMAAWERGVKGNRSPAEISSVLFMNYKVFVSGPLLSATVLPAFALEAFVRHCAEIAVRRQTNSVAVLELAMVSLIHFPRLKGRSLREPWWKRPTSRRT